jgi:hypothetical protein
MMVLPEHPPKKKRGGSVVIVIARAKFSKSEMNS